MSEQVNEVYSGMEDLMEAVTAVDGPAEDLTPDEEVEAEAETGGEGEGESSAGQEEEKGQDTGGVAEEEAEAAKAEPTTETDPYSEINSLRKLLRQQRQEMAELRNAQQKQELAAAARDEQQRKMALQRTHEESFYDDSFGGQQGADQELGQTKPESPPTITTKYDELKGQLDSIISVKGPVLDTLAATMIESGKYPDIEQVCAQENFDAVFDAVAEKIAREHNVDFSEARLSVELNVWQKPNPYKYMYDIIKANFSGPAKAVAASPPKEDEAAPAPAPKKAETPKKAEAPKAAGTVVGVGGGSPGSAGWTAKAIDNLPEERLSEVPADVYEKYLLDELD